MTDLKLGVSLFAQASPWPELLDTARRIDRLGYDSLWTWDHLYAIFGDPYQPIFEGWGMLHAWAMATQRVRLGLMVGANTFRNPGHVAKLAATLDHVSGGRAILGLGAGWFEREHEAFGFDFGSGFGERLDRLIEAVPLVRRLLDGEEVTHEGRFYRFDRAVCAPRPVQDHLPILIGGSGPRKTIPLIARSADMWNLYGTPEEVATADAALREACSAVGRDEREIERTVNLNVVIRRDHQAAERAWDLWYETHRPRRGERGLNAGGSLDNVAEMIAAYRDVGFAHPVLIFRTPFDFETMERLPELRARLDAV
jgi:F420-dependent oxidoreductase-like protein